MGLLKLFKIVTPYILNAFTREIDDNLRFEVFTSKRKVVPDRVQRAMNVVYDLALELACDGDVLGQTCAYVPWNYEIEPELSADMYNGAMQFVLGHEIAHIHGEHYELLRGEVDRHLPTRTSREQ